MARRGATQIGRLETKRPLDIVLGKMKYGVSRNTISMVGKATDFCLPISLIAHDMFGTVPKSPDSGEATLAPLKKNRTGILSNTVPVIHKHNEGTRF